MGVSQVRTKEGMYGFHIDGLPLMCLFSFSVGLCLHLILSASSSVLLPSFTRISVSL